MILQQKLRQEGDKLILTNKIDCKAALDLVSDANKSGGQRGKTMRCIGHIPPEYWMFDPWLLQAKKAMQAGDKYEYMKMINKFFSIHPAFKIEYSARYFAGGVGEQ